MIKQIENQRILIAGGSSGIGLATAQLLSGLGAIVTITGRDEKRLQKVKQENPKLNITKLDSSDPANLQAFFSSSGTFHHLIISVSGSKGAGSFPNLSLDELRTGFDQKFWSHLETIQAALPFVEKTGSVTLVTAASSSARLPGTSGLAAINGALEIMVPILAKDLQPLRINAVSPGVIDTAWWDFLNEADKADTFAHFSKQVCVGRVGQAEEVANAILSVVINNYVNGIVLSCHGGLG